MGKVAENSDTLFPIANGKRIDEDAATRITSAIVEARKRFEHENPGKMFMARMAEEVIRGQLAIEFPKAKRLKRVNGRDVIFDAIAEACGIDLTCLTPREAGKIVDAKAEIMAASPDVTPEQIHKKARAYKSKYKDCACTPNALAGHWAELSAGKSAKPEGPDLYAEPDAAWRGVLRSIGVEKDWPDERIEELTESRWVDVPIYLREMVLKRIT